jgi:hypothetical protein
MTDKPTLVTLDPKDDFKAALEKLKRTETEMSEYFTIIARVKRKYFLDLEKEGFTKDQALMMTMNMI